MVAEKKLEDAEAEKQALLSKIARLEQEAQQKVKDAELEKQKEKDHELEKQKQNSRLEELLTKTLSRVDQLESSIQNVGNKTPQEQHEKKVKVSGSKPLPDATSRGDSDDGGNPAHDESDEDSEDETFLTTPSGQKVPVTHIWCTWF